MIFSENRFSLLGIMLYCAANVFTKIENAPYAGFGNDDACCALPARYRIRFDSNCRICISKPSTTFSNAALRHGR
jgi:hypothetical protein